MSRAVTTHAEHEVTRQCIVRTVKGGRWRLLYPVEPDRDLTLPEAVRIVTSDSRWHVVFGQAGGRQFDAAVRKASR